MASNTKTLLHFEDLALPSEQVLFGLRCSSLTMLKQNSVGLRMGQVSKVVEVEGLEIYCSIYKDAAKDLSLSNTGGSESWFNSHSVGDKSEHIIEPFNVSLSLLVCKFYWSFLILLLKIYPCLNFIIVSM
ncbi:hypothetical protein E1A91_A08G087500v1 [Gossypium mustelinum]|uniref:Uncharacterized protein n=1 Tax=Gossypium mustelinum TaxID=34275 RepID=A0A5D2Y6K9_GOSMU|nr:hypothetical protein E1A91_A08G087500v1 [Gossypium mustelinum]